MNVWGVTFGGYLAKILSFKSGDLLYKSIFYLLSEGTVHSFPKFSLKKEKSFQKSPAIADWVKFSMIFSGPWSSLVKLSTLCYIQPLP